MAVTNFESASYFKLKFDITSGAPGESRTNVDISYVYHKQTLNIMDTLDPDCALTHEYSIMEPDCDLSHGYPGV
jgi:hypothetical protein